jgi:phosphohistidine phosphatase
MEILLVRHGLAGKADPRRHPDDDTRPLTPKGRRSFRRAAKGLLALDCNPSRIFTSPALRALETARLLADRLDLRARDVAAAEELRHSADPEAALKSLARLRPSKRIALVGHEPWLGRFVSLLISGSADAKVEIGKGGACLVEAEALHAGAGSLVWMMTQDQLIAFARR